MIARMVSRSKQSGYTLLVLLFVFAVMAIGLMAAVPVWQTQVRREMEEELIFRGKQYVEAVRIFQTKKPGSFPRSLDELLEEKCIRRLYPDPMTKHGEWNIILPYQRIPASRTAQRETRRTTAPERSRPMPEGSIQKILVVPLSALPSVDNPQIIGVVSPSTRTSIKLYHEQESYDKWLFFYGFDPNQMPEIVYFGQENKG